MYKSFSCTYFRLPKSYIQEMGEVILQPIHNVVGICKQITIMISYQFSPLSNTDKDLPLCVPRPLADTVINLPLMSCKRTSLSFS
jgi:hypothetical protein